MERNASGEIKFGMKRNSVVSRVWVRRFADKMKSTNRDECLLMPY